MTHTKQLKITKLFRKGAIELPEDCDELQEEVQQLEQKLKEKQNELFQLQRNSYRQKICPVKKKSELFIKPEKIILSNSVDSLRKDLELMSMLSGIEVQSYVASDHCAIVYHMQHDSEHEIKHGLMIDMKTGKNKVSKSSLPLGFNLDTVLEGFDNVMLPECLGAIRKALVAYYDRLDQFNALKTKLNHEVQQFRVLDGSHVELQFAARNALEEDGDNIPVSLLLDYRVYDVRPKQISFVEIEMPEESVEMVRQQCAVFRRKPLLRAFREAFITGAGPYLLLRQLGSPAEARRPRKRRAPPHNIDDTFRPDDCSDSADD